MRSALLTEALSQSPTNTLYHYTTQLGMLGIIKNKQIWAAHTQYLNDSREYRHALDLVKEEIQRCLKEAANEEARRILTDMAAGLGDLERMNVCVCSFSEERDSLSQWRAYGDSSSGYAIGFSPQHLTEAVTKEEFFLARCRYADEEQNALVAALVSEVLEENLQRVRDGEELIGETPGNWMKSNGLLPQGGNLAAYLNRYAPILKDNSFQDEKEWRIISRPLSCKREGFDFRAGHSMLIPFYRFPLSCSDQPMKIEEIVVGPTPHPEQSRSSLKSFLVSQRLSNVKVSISTVPYRNW